MARTILLVMVVLCLLLATSSIVEGHVWRAAWQVSLSLLFTWVVFRGSRPRRL